MIARIGSRRIPVFRSPDTTQKIGGVWAAAGEAYPLIAGHDRHGVGWMRIAHPECAEPVWIVAESGGTWARREEAATPMATASPGDPAGLAIAWARELAPQLVEVTPNAGPVLDERVLDPYRRYNQLTGPMAYCAVFAMLAQGVGLGLVAADGSDAHERARWKRHPLGRWTGATHEIEQLAKVRGLWSQVPTPAAMACRERAGSGSDASSSSYAGHTSLVVERLGGGQILVIDANVSDRVVERVVPATDYRGFVGIGAGS